MNNKHQKKVADREIRAVLVKLAFLDRIGGRSSDAIEL